MDKRYPSLSALRMLCAAALILFAAGASAEEPPALDAAELVARYPKGAIGSVEAADKALAEVARTRREINARYARDEQACLPNFFTTSCIDKAKDKQREDLKRLRPIELESNTFKRQARVEKRDADLAGRQQKAEEKRIEAENGPPAAPRLPRDPAPEKTARPGAVQTAEERVAGHEAKMQELRAKEEADAPRRAARAEAYERKVQASQKRMEEVAKRKEEKDARRRAKEKAGEPSSPAAVMRP